MQENVKKYFNTRGIDKSLLDNFKITSDNSGIHIPVFSPDGQYSFSKHRALPGTKTNMKYWFDQGSSPALYNAHLIKDESTVVICEGEVDSIVLWSAGIAAVSSTAGCLTFKDEWIDLLKGKKIYICFDNDDPGRKAMATLLQKIPDATPLFIDDVNDISDYFAKHHSVKPILKLTDVPESFVTLLADLQKEQTYTPPVKKTSTKYDSDDRVEKAKQIPITEYAKFGRDKKMKCFLPGHTGERTASLAYDPKNNTFKCFGCGEFGDSIAFYMAHKNVDFVTALNEMVGPAPVPTVQSAPSPIVNTDEPSEDIDIPEEKTRPEFYMSGGKKPAVRKIGSNIQMIFESDNRFHNKFRFDSFRSKFETKFGGFDKWMPLEDDFVQAIIDEIQKIYPYFDTGMTSTIKNHIIIAARQNTISPPLEYIKAIKWDKKERLKTWLHHTYKVEDNAYHAEVGKRWLNGLVKRLAYPGCQFDNVLVVEGPQNFGKSRILRTLCDIPGEAMLFDETAETPDNSKEFALTLLGNMVVEFAEGAIAGYKNQQKVKSFITKVDDNYRPPFTKNTDRHPRQCVFAMTTNDSEYLKDKTGERRYWPVAILDDVELGDWDWVKDNRDQLFAEAYTHIDSKYTALPDEVQEYLDELIEGRKEVDPLEDTINMWFSSLSKGVKEGGLTIKEGKDQVLESEFKTKYLDKEIAHIYRHVLHLKRKRARNEDGTRPAKYYPTTKTPMHDGPNNFTTDTLKNEYNKDF